jgi:hypothetical protein
MQVDDAGGSEGGAVMVPRGVPALPHAERRLTSCRGHTTRILSKPSTEAQSLMGRLERQASSGLATGTVPARSYRQGRKS